MLITSSAQFMRFPAGGTGAMEKAKILVVDDTPANVKLLVDLLEAQQFSVITASSEKRPCASSRLSIRISSYWTS